MLTILSKTSAQVEPCMMIDLFPMSQVFYMLSKGGHTQLVATFGITHPIFIFLFCHITIT
jgi:hypothetical protein